MQRIVILGKPGVGKTTLVKTVIESFPGCFRGFYTEEIREGRERVGFRIKTLSGKEGILAKRDQPSPFRIGRYGVLLQDLETMGIPEIEDAIRGKSPLLLDEVGKMEFCSFRFRQALFQAWDVVPLLLVTSCFPPLPEFRDLLESEAVKKFVLDRENRNRLGREIVSLVQVLLEF
ncbi:MAG: hypothetical protein HPY68_06625 [Candidatus Atribacteria bacterium]|nr:hypothetical protein [Candidatus Atribacteria bacterium]